MALTDDVRTACARVAGRARQVRIVAEAIEPYARTRLGWAPPWDLAAAIDMTVEWHLADRDVSLEQIERHGATAAREGVA